MVRQLFHAFQTQVPTHKLGEFYYFSITTVNQALSVDLTSELTPIINFYPDKQKIA